MRIAKRRNHHYRNILAALLLLLPTITGADSTTTATGLDEEIQSLKQDIVALNRSLFMLEEELLCTQMPQEMRGRVCKQIHQILSYSNKQDLVYVQTVETLQLWIELMDSTPYSVTQRAFEDALSTLQTVLNSQKP